MLAVVGPGVVHVTIGERAVSDSLATDHGLVGADRVAAETGGIAERNELAQRLQRGDAGFLADHSLWCGERLFAVGKTEHVGRHQGVDGDGGEGDQVPPRQCQQVVPGARHRCLRLRQHVGAPGGDRGGGVDRQRPKVSAVLVAGERDADTVGALIGEKRCRQPILQREQRRVRGGVTGEGVVDDDQVEALGEPLDWEGSKLLQRARLPGNADVEPGVDKSLRGSHQGQVAAGVVPGDAGERAPLGHVSLHAIRESRTMFTDESSLCR